MCYDSTPQVALGLLGELKLIAVQYCAQKKIKHWTTSVRICFCHVHCKRSANVKGVLFGSKTLQDLCFIPRRYGNQKSSHFSCHFYWSCDENEDIGTPSAATCIHNQIKFMSIEHKHTCLMSATRTSGRDKVWLGHEPQKELWSALFVFLLYNIALPHIISIHVDFYWVEYTIQWTFDRIACNTETNESMFQSLRSCKDYRDTQ